MKGQIKIRKGNENQEPMVVYVSHWNKNMGFWVCHKLNTEGILLSKKRDLIDFEYKAFKILYYQWKIKNTDKVKQNFTKLLEEVNPST